ncbi:MAG: RluA family pseudouridine synthase [Clostridia bacterium]|nr:RluA family pseudouridine synthase [Clostridia bacterium]
MRYIIDKSNEKITIKDFLKKNRISSNLLKRLKKIPNGILVNSSHQNVTYVLKENDILELNTEDFLDDENEYLEPANIPLEIIYEDENLTVVNKPSDMPTHESLNNRGNSLANALRYRYLEKPYVFRATNRLDKDTSGVVITANNRFYASLLSEKIKSGKVKKEYIAIVKGKLEGEGEINAPIDRIEKSIIKRVVREDGESAITRYKSIFATSEASIILLTPITGRTHQLRVHLSYIGHPIIGDRLYGEESQYIARQALHCLKMEVDEIGKFYAPLAQDIKSLIRRYFDNEELIPKD